MMESFESCLDQKRFGGFIRSHRRFACALFLCFLLLRVNYPVPSMPCSQALICVLQGDHDDTGRLEKAEGSKSRNGGLLQKRTKHVMNIDEHQGTGKKPEALWPKLKLMLLLLRRCQYSKIYSILVGNVLMHLQVLRISKLSPKFLSHSPF